MFHEAIQKIKVTRLYGPRFTAQHVMQYNKLAYIASIQVDGRYNVQFPNVF